MGKKKIREVFFLKEATKYGVFWCNFPLFIWFSF